ncbi:uncharacterized protein TNCV_1916191 [Trichonephila clavipes]|uniref:Uncharacterized protein n=1 Tax=Trichonephila clavipes TaxID=2585209 RepID=A0A8X6W0I4_TRICX|nr:uncharacterized protein TNCV_1916191 [Trichonephila clavipes]
MVPRSHSVDHLYVGNSVSRHSDSQVDRVAHLHDACSSGVTMLRLRVHASSPLHIHAYLEVEENNVDANQLQQIDTKCWKQHQSASNYLFNGHQTSNTSELDLKLSGVNRVSNEAERIPQITIRILESRNLLGNQSLSKRDPRRSLRDSHNTLKTYKIFGLVLLVATVAEWYKYRIVAGFVTSSRPVTLKTRRVGQRCTLNLSRVEKSSRWCGVVVWRGGARSGVVHVT